MSTIISLTFDLFLLALSVRSAVDVVGGGADTVDDDCC